MLASEDCTEQSSADDEHHIREENKAKHDENGCADPVGDGADAFTGKQTVDAPRDGGHHPCSAQPSKRYEGQYHHKIHFVAHKFPKGAVSDAISEAVAITLIARGSRNDACERDGGSA